LVTSVTATITGTVNPASTGPNSEAFYFFEYSTGPIPGQVVECESPCVRVPSSLDEKAGQGTSDIPVATQLPASGQPPLKPNTTYHYRVVAYNGNLFKAVFGGAAVFGLETEFKTLPIAPAAITDPPVTVGSSSARLSGEVAGHGALTTYSFEFGTSTAYGSSAPLPAAEATPSAKGQYVTVSVEGLQPDTTYHFRLLDTNSGGKGEGEDQTFTTNTASQPGYSPLPPGFSLIGTAPAWPTAAIFPNLTGLAPTPASSPGTKGSTSGPSTRAYRLAKALKACKKYKNRAKRARCERDARRKSAARAR
jgi:hypothetical protein